MSENLFLATMVCGSFCGFYLFAAAPMNLFVIYPMERKARRAGFTPPAVLFPLHPWAILYKVCGYSFALTDRKVYRYRVFFKDEEILRFKEIRLKYGDSIFHKTLFWVMKVWMYAAILGGFFALIVVLLNWDYFQSYRSN